MKIIKDILASKTGYLMMFSHWLLCAWAIYQRGGLTGHFHLYYEPILFKSIVIVDLFWLTFTESFIQNPRSVFLVGFLLAGIQWFLIGYFIGKIKTNKLK